MRCDDQNFVKCNYSEGPSVWAGSFEKLLEDPLGLHMFAEFLKKEFSAENIYFWIACERYKTVPTENDRRNEAQRIYLQHLSAGSTESVNVDAQARQSVENNIHAANVDLFVQAQKQIFNLMKFDSYPRFLRSDIYRKCLTGGEDKLPVDIRLLLQPLSSPTKLKKSVSNAEDRRRKSLLPWHRKNRSKSKDRGESDYNRKINDITTSGDLKNLDRCDQADAHSSGSSLTSLDLAVSSQDLIRHTQTSHDELSSNAAKTALCRVVLLSIGSTTVVQIKQSETVQELVTRLLEKRGLQYSSFEVYKDKSPKCVNIEESSETLAGCEVSVEQRVVFKLDLPNRKMISIRSKYTKIIVDVLRPSLHKYQFNLDQMVVLNGNTPIDLHQPVTSIDGVKLKVLYKEDFIQENANPSAKNNCGNKMRLEEITNKVFEGILQEKSESVTYKPAKSDRGSVKSEDWGSEHSSTFIGKFLRRDSGIHERKKKMTSRYKAGIEETTSDLMKKPLIAKLKCGANKFNVSRSESDELVEGLTRAQRRIDDQRGTEINFELPDFLKDKENEQIQKQTRRGELECNAKFYVGDTSVPANTDKLPVIYSAKNMKPELQSNYENRNVLVPNKYQDTRMNVSPNKSEAVPAKRSPVKSTNVSKDITEPPPLPPKPKVVPIKPPNWGQLNGFYKSKDISGTDRKQAMFLEQASSSFV